MFKIPSYSDIEKKEKEISEKGAQLKLNLFQNKRKEIEESKKADAETLATAAVSKPATISTETTSPRTLPTSSAEDFDEDDLLLCNIDLNGVVACKKPKMDEPKPKPVETFKKPVPPPTSVIKLTAEPTGSSHGSAMGSTALLVNSKQRGNPILKHVRNVPWRYSDTLTPDYSMGRNSCALYLSMKYHLLNNEYIHERLRELGRAYELRVLLVLVDIKETKHCLKELEKICILANLTLILAWSYEEAGRYLETYKAYEHKSADGLQEKTVVTGNNAENAFMQNFTEFLCAIKSVNKTDASTLRQTFGSLKNISEAGKTELSIVPGFGPLKVNRIYEIFRTPFLLENDKNYKKNDS
jgi:DNA excision repair protein ERCC-1